MEQGGQLSGGDAEPGVPRRRLAQTGAPHRPTPTPGPPALVDGVGGIGLRFRIQTHPRGQPHQKDVRKKRESGFKENGFAET